MRRFIRITIISRSREIQIITFPIRCKNGYIRGPFLLEGAFIGLLGQLFHQHWFTLSITECSNLSTHPWWVKTYL